MSQFTTQPSASIPTAVLLYTLNEEITYAHSNPYAKEMAKIARSSTGSTIHNQSTKGLSVSFASIAFYLPFAISLSPRTAKADKDN